ncbi:Multifunctional cyclase-dehydratase-3-O-methyl transferase TcmN [Marinomonas spartinae]|uniref:Multifunctional cyclase-dehydratase-3-O-methyl transferase TcmN n=1 Tax=Marinomonas spartinae TaxID=1792290 RepID=A0A1A8TPA2_9GAMM|nr:methyltransferase [Marinomonas spartinae]SBS34263.1 Multifunctional cyclase-dehydratase-3-O-methyl transferase TcmN [Marinomonas spartinae]SBS34866.1 Multifunctional cyclase-dehydratase-3-O-methyl transferase TcmN [Marinomonas spartinae]
MKTMESIGKISEMMMLPLAAKSLNVAAEIGVADIINESTIHIETLSESMEVDKVILLNLIKVTSLFGFFTIDSDGYVKNSDYSMFLTTDHPQSMRQFCRLFGHEYYNAYDGLLHTTKTTNSGFKHIYSKTLYEYLDDTPDRALVYDLAMRDFSRPVGKEITKTFAEMFSNSKKIIDIGGGSGVITIEVLKQFGHLTGCIFDREDVCTRNKDHLPKSVRDRITLHPGDFFDSVPSGYDVYILKNVLHNWNDQSSSSILKTISRSIGNGRLLIVEPIVTKKEDSPRLIFNALFQSVICEDGTHPRDTLDIESLVNATGFTIARAEKLLTGHTAFELVKPSSL